MENLTWNAKIKYIKGKKYYLVSFKKEKKYKILWISESLVEDCYRLLEYVNYNWEKFKTSKDLLKIDKKILKAPFDNFLTIEI